MEKFKSVRTAGPVADQPSRFRTPPGVGGEGWPVSLLCSRNARPLKDEGGAARCPSCSQNAHDEAVLVRCAQSRAALATPLKRGRKNWKIIVGRAQLKTNRATLYMEARANLVRALADDWLPGQRHPLGKSSRPRGRGETSELGRSIIVGGRCVQSGTNQGPLS